MFSPSQELFGESSGLTLIRVPWVPKISRIVVSKNEKRRVVQRTRLFSCPQNQGHTDPDSTRLQTIDQTLEPVRTRRFRARRVDRSFVFLAALILANRPDVTSAISRPRVTSLK